MKKNTLNTVVALLADLDFENKEELMNELYTELNRGAEERAKKASEYDVAWAVVHDVLMGTNTPLTVAEIFEECKGNLPEGFAKGRVQYGLTHNWADAIVKIEGKPNTYRLA